MIRKAFSSIALALVSSSVLAMSATPKTLDTEIVFTNSTPDTLQVVVSGNAQVQQKITELGPLASATLAKVTRNASADSRLNIQLSSNNYQINLTQQTQGTNLSFGANTSDLLVAPQTNANIQRFNTILAGDKNTLAFNAENLGKGGKLTYVLHEQDKKPALGKANQFNVLSYNIWATTIFGSKKVDSRLNQMPAVMAGYDALVLTEVFDHIQTTQLLNELRTEYPYQSSDVFTVGKLMGSGTRILSRWPISVEDSFKYTVCNGIQCAATRGVIYLKINKQGNPYHVFATHTQSEDDDANRNMRLAQLQQMGEYIRSLNIPADEPVIMAGDFNVNKIDLAEDRDYLEAVLGATEPANRGHGFSYDADTNFWAKQPYVQFLDYTLTSNNHLQPNSAYQEIFAPRTMTDALWGEWDLSDHYAARGVFSYPTESQPLRAAFPFVGDIVHFKTANGYYMRSMSGGNSFISAGSDQMGTWESYTLKALENGQYAIQAFDGHYVALDSYLLGTLKASSDNISSAGSFTLVDLGNNSLALKADNGKYLRADFGGSAGLSAGSNSIGKNQTFKLIRR
ncbi:endonuclease/exonuclease/phosphatase family protein [Pelagibaculum spongiae]|uniref:endonuclease/exonuclease/phosphatase family protein n=1 Tax=Pelagibaculum spongiae TaxID=2080658 RepID=UPI001314F7A1|nr:endonuclease/exonuclease/phosphatase family protein [Pelagibaculum spongiae]